MKVRINGTEKHYRTVWMEGSDVCMIDQRLLPHEFKILKCRTHLDTVEAVKDLAVRGAGAIGGAAGYAMAQAVIEGAKLKEKAEFYPYIAEAEEAIKNSRPTAQNLFYAVERVMRRIRKSGRLGETLESLIGADYDALIKGMTQSVDFKEIAQEAVKEANQIADDDAEACRMIGVYGNELIKDGARISTHCNAGWLAFVDNGSALSPIYAAKAAGKNVFVYVDMTMPVMQGARLTAWELLNEGVPHVIVPDNETGSLIQQGMVDMVIVGSDRIAANGDVANKIGTYPLAVLADRHRIPFYVAAPTSTIDPKCKSGKLIPIEERSGDEVLWIPGMTKAGKRTKVRIAPEGSPALNRAFDVTPAELVAGIITEKGIYMSKDIIYALD